MSQLATDKWPTRLRWRVVIVAGLCLVALVVAALVLQGTTSDLPKRTGVPFIRPPLVAPSIAETMKLPPSVTAGATEPTAVTDGDLPEVNQPLDAVQSLPGGGLVVHTMRFDGIPLGKRSTPSVLPDSTVRGTPDLGPPGTTLFDVSHSGSGPTLVAARQLANGNLRVTVLGLRQGLPKLQATTVPTPRPRGTRTIAVATWDAPAPDLFVLDRGGGRVPVTVRVYSGESGFRKLLLGVQLPIVEPDSKSSLLDVARVQGGHRPDVILVKRRGLSGDPEAHFISGDDAFSAFDQHLAVPARPLAPGDQVAVGTRLGQATAYVVGFGPRAGTVGLMTLPYTARVPS